MRRLLPALLLSLAACDGDGTPLGLEEVAGDYSLAEVNGEDVPYGYVLTVEYILAVSEGTLSLEADGDYAVEVWQTFTALAPPYEEVRESYSELGRYSVGDNTIRFEPAAPDTTWTGTIGGPEVTVNVPGWWLELPEGMVLTFRK